MSIRLDLGTKPKGLMVKIHGDILRSVERSNTVHIGEYSISLVDFLFMAEYVLTNTPLMENDPRRQFVRCVKSMTEELWVTNKQTYLKNTEPALLAAHIDAALSKPKKKPKRRKHA